MPFRHGGFRAASAKLRLQDAPAGCQEGTKVAIVDPTDVYEVWYTDFLGGTANLATDLCSNLAGAQFRLENQWGSQGEIWHRVITDGLVTYTQVEL